MEGPGDLHHTDIEIGGVDDLNSPVGRIDILRAVVGLHMEVEGLRRQVGMEFTGLAVDAGTAVVVDAVGDIARLLHLSQQDAAADGVDTARREVENITGLDGMVGQDLGDGAVGNATLILVGRDGRLEAGIEMGPLLCLDDVPHLGLAHLAVQTLRHLVVGVDLDAQVVAGIDELHQERQLAVIGLAHLVAQDGLGMSANDGDEVKALPLAIADDGGAGGDGTDFPTFANGVVRALETFIRSEAVAAPDNLVKVGFEKERIKIHLP